ncbi:hypothetical protein [Streptomyces sp. NPDC048496]|uniref:hypothetical protein n=1 Tax=Streptomyces sp. NPDC048496 TaxID=3365558 RepID=UPI0037228BF7
MPTQVKPPDAPADAAMLVARSLVTGAQAVASHTCPARRPGLSRHGCAPKHS